MAEDDLDKSIRDINRQLESLSEQSSHSTHCGRYGIYSVALSLGLLLIFSVIYLGASLTGFVTFSETVLHSEYTPFVIEDSQTIRLRPDMADIDALMLSGTVSGSGRALVFLETDQGRKLVYFFEGDADQGKTFSDICFDTCHLANAPEELILSVELENTRLDIDKVTYMHSNMIDISLEPEYTTMDYSLEKAKVIDLKITNRRHADYSVILLLDGPLTDHFTWQGSLIRMTARDFEKTVPITVRLPSNLPSGTYDHRITARYVPPDTHEFSGTAPVAESFITVYVP